MAMRHWLLPAVSESVGLIILKSVLHRKAKRRAAFFSLLIQNRFKLMHMEPEVIYLFHADVGYVPKKNKREGNAI